MEPALNKPVSKSIGCNFQHSNQFQSESPPDSDQFLTALWSDDFGYKIQAQVGMWGTRCTCLGICLLSYDRKYRNKVSKYKTF